VGEEKGRALVRREWYQKLIEEYNQRYGTYLRITKRMIDRMVECKFKREDVESVLYMMERYNKPIYWIIQWRLKYGYTFEEIDSILEAAEYLKCQIYTVRRILDVCDRDLYNFYKLIDYIITNRFDSERQILKFIRYLEINFANIEEFFMWLDYEEQIG